MAKQSADPKPIETEFDIWSRLRESMKRLAEVGSHKIDPQTLARKREARARQVRGRAVTDRSGEQRLTILAFSKGNQRYGIPAQEVVEVQALEQFSPVPGTPAFIPGVIHWRGDVLALLDIGKLFGIPESGLADIHVCVVVEAARRRVAIVAFDIDDLLALPRAEIVPAPVLPGNTPLEWLTGVHDQNRMILKMDSILRDSRLSDWRH